MFIECYLSLCVIANWHFLHWIFKTFSSFVLVSNSFSESHFSPSGECTWFTGELICNRRWTSSLFTIATDWADADWMLKSDAKKKEDSTLRQFFKTKITKRFNLCFWLVCLLNTGWLKNKLWVLSTSKLIEVWIDM